MQRCDRSSPARQTSARPWRFSKSSRAFATCFVFITPAVPRVPAVIQPLRLTAIELQLAPIRYSLHIPVDSLMEHFKGADVRPDRDEERRGGQPDAR